MRAKCRINNIITYGNFSNNGAKEVALGSFNGGEDDEQISVGLVEISDKICDAEQFLLWNNILLSTCIIKSTIHTNDYTQSGMSNVITLPCSKTWSLKTGDNATKMTDNKLIFVNNTHHSRVFSKNFQK